MSRYLGFVTLDVFTAVPFAGNPLAVVFLPDSSSKSISQEQKQAIAREFNLSETIFIHPLGTGSPNKRGIDIFMTDRELPFAGHPTIGAASWLLHLSPEVGQYPRVDTIVTKAGEITTHLSSTLEDVVSASIPYDAHIHKAQFPLSELLRLHPSLAPAFADAGRSTAKVFQSFLSLKALARSLWNCLISPHWSQSHLLQAGNRSQRSLFPREGTSTRTGEDLVSSFFIFTSEMRGTRPPKNQLFELA